MSFPLHRISKKLPSVLVVFFYLAVVVWITVHTTALDYAAYLISAHGFLAGQDVYQWTVIDFQTAARQLQIPNFAYPYRYSPVTALIISPLLLLSYRPGLFIWSLINAAAIIAAGELLSRLAEGPAKRWSIRLSVWLFAPFLVSLYAGQVNPLVTLLGAVAILSFHRGRERAAGCWISLAFLIKPLVIGIAGYAFWKGKWRMAGTFLIIAAVLLGLMACLFGWGSVQSGVPLSVAGVRAGAYPPLQNFWGMVSRWFTVHEYGWHFTNQPALAENAGLLLSIGLAIATMLFCLPAIRPDSWRDADLGMAIIAVTLIVPATWYHHYAILAIPLAILFANAEAGIDVILACSAWLAINIFGVAWHDLAGHTLLLDMGTIGAMVLWIGLARVSRRQRRQLLQK